MAGKSKKDEETPVVEDVETDVPPLEIVAGDGFATVKLGKTETHLNRLQLEQFARQVDHVKHSLN